MLIGECYWRHYDQNFEEVKKQLAELSEVVNKFKSEAVQLRIVDLVFAGAKV